MKNILILLFLSSIFTLGCSSSKSSTATSSESSTTDTPTSTYSGINWNEASSLEDAQARTTDKRDKIYLDVSAVWCGYCKKMKKSVYTDDDVAYTINKSYIPLALDGEQGEGISFASKHKIKGYPTQLILDADGVVLKKHVGYLSVDQLLNFLN